MKRLVSMLLVSVFALSLSACAAMKGDETVKVKCPACGYEFNAPAKN